MRDPQSLPSLDFLPLWITLYRKNVTVKDSPGFVSPNDPEYVGLPKADLKTAAPIDTSVDKW